MAERRKVVVDGEEFEVAIDRDGEYWNVEIEGHSFSIKIDDEASNQNLKVRKRSGSKRKLSGKISSSIPGKIVSLNVKCGDIVKQGDVVMILEAMKMQNEITAPISGKIIEINCTTGGNIEANMPLVILDNIDK